MINTVLYNRLPTKSVLHAFLISILWLPGCSVLDGIIPESGIVPDKYERATLASYDLSELKEIDTAVKLNNRWLSDHITQTLLAEADKSDQYNFKNLKLTFNHQFISLKGIVNVSDKYQNIISGTLAGELRLNLNSSRLDWIAHVDQLAIESTDFSFDGGQYAEAIPELEENILNNINNVFFAGLSKKGLDSITLNAIPLGEIQVGAELAGVSSSPARHTEPLRGVFLKADDAVMIEPDYTSFALDFVFLPNISYCPAEITVSRAIFSRHIESREPVGATRKTANANDIRYFFSEISGARKAHTIIHYWYTNGQAVAVEELHIGVSERWRTWSSLGKGFAPGDRLEVLVVEKESGCILLSKAIELSEPQALFTQTQEGQAREQKSFDEYRQEFDQRTADLSISESTPDLAIIKSRRSFFASALQNSIADLNVVAGFDDSEMARMQWESRLNPFDPETIACQHRSCPPPPVCEINISHCKRFRDTRDCTSCLFRNPLNNRCISEAIDPVCEASRNRQNARYDAERTACINSAQTSKQECDFLNSQANRSCQIEATFADNACDSIKSSISNLKPGAPLAYIRATARLQGKLNANFSHFRIEGDLERLKLDMSLSSDMQLRGDMNFSPGTVARPLANCIASWSAPFQSRFSNTPAVDNLQGQLEQDDNLLIASWSGFGMTIDTNPSPLESVLVGNPQLLANCKIGLTVGKVEQAITGGDAEFYRGRLNLETQLLPTKIHLAPASLLLGDSAHSAKAQLTATSVLYEFTD